MSFVKFVICPCVFLGRFRNKRSFFFFTEQQKKIFIIEWEIKGFVFHSVLFAVIVARARFKLVSDGYDCKHFLNLFF